MITHLARAFLAHTLRPFLFLPAAPEPYNLDLLNLGLYIHVPFCRSICDFCPYNKTAYNKELLERFIKALITEIEMVCGENTRPRAALSLYLGGGSPALAIDYLPEVVEAINARFTVEKGFAIELHPDDVTQTVLAKLKNTGFEMVSIGIQSFHSHLLAGLGRKPVDGREKVRAAVETGFSTVDVDLIFCLPGQTADDLVSDFETAADLGATQISTYPFINFSYTNQKRRAQGRRQQKYMLASLIRRSEELGLTRSSVWSFTKPGTGKYSSVTRDNYVGFGPSAASLLQDRFCVNTFSVDAYISSIEAGKMPTALTMDFTERTRALYWLFWSSYNTRIDPDTYSLLFNREIHDVFGPALRAGIAFGLLDRDGSAYRLTDRGAYWFHLIEQKYTHQYIDKTWRICGTEAWPRRIVLY